MPANHYKRPDGKRPRRFTKAQILKAYADKIEKSRWPHSGQPHKVLPPYRSPIEQAIIDGRMSWDTIGRDWYRLLFHPKAMHCGYGDEALGWFKSELALTPTWKSAFNPTGEKYDFHSSHEDARRWVEERAAKWLAQREASDGVR